VDNYAEDVVAAYLRREEISARSLTTIRSQGTGHPKGKATGFGNREKRHRKKRGVGKQTDTVLTERREKFREKPTPSNLGMGK